MRTTQRQKMLLSVVTYLTLAGLVVGALFPFYWIGLTSLRKGKQVYVKEQVLVPRDLTLENYQFVFTERPTAQWLRNSLVMAFSSSGIAVVIGVLAGYSIVRLKFRGNRSVARGVLFTYLVPTSLLFIPMFILMFNLRLTEGLWGLLLAYLSFNVPFCTWLILGYFRSIPEELEDAARIDGCSRLGVLWRIVLPLAAPGIVTAFIFGFTNSWNEFLYAVTLVRSRDLMTLPTGLGSYILGDVFLWGPLMATAIITALPPVILFIVVQRFVVAGMTLGSVKG
ncbi:MAG: carbohydrate ABC transporter permease [Caldilineaceae bacterium]|nr:carbohydrate ABC transporter permease [Caldilineaceae bacterium]MCB0183697.1 carbohydrate ABC transporter permease [Caldilineaceae bacterium]